MVRNFNWIPHGTTVCPWKCKIFQETLPEGIEGRITLFPTDRIRSNDAGYKIQQRLLGIGTLSKLNIGFK